MTNALPQERVRPIYRPEMNDHLQPTKRAWMFLGRHGGPCDKACKMCYYAFQQQLVFFSLSTLMSHANLFRYHYGLEYCDISGGEATIFGVMKNKRRPELEKLIAHCRAIGLLPTIITHGQNNTAELVKGVEDAGLEDWLISLHGMKAGHEQTVVNHKGSGEGGWERLTQNLAHCTRPVRFNTTLQNFNYEELPELAEWLVNTQAPTVWNMIEFNPFYAWHERPDIDFQTQSSVLAPYVGEAVQIAEAGGWEVNVRYFAPCIAEPYGFAKNCIGFFQTQIDNWEWSLSATNRYKQEQADQAGGWHELNLAHCRAISASRANDKCTQCRFFGTVCEGPPVQYIQRYGVDELTPSIGELVIDPAYFERGGQFTG